MSQDEQQQVQAPNGNLPAVMPGGAFTDSLMRNNKKIRQDRADALSEDTELIYKREIEDLDRDVRTLHRERNNMLDLSPTDVNSLTHAKDYDAKAFVSRDLEIGVELRTLQIKLDIARERYLFLFGRII